MRIRTLELSLWALLFLAPRAGAGLLSPGSVAVLDGNQAPRLTFNNNERITFQQRVFNGAASVNRISFTFIVLAPGGAEVFRIAGNQVPGSVGNAATQLAGFPITKFYTAPGVYTLQAQAALDAQVITQQATFVVSSPNLLLLYPPNGAQNIADIPLTFSWSSSGGSTYRVTVGNNPSFFNALFSQVTTGPETVLSYPINPSDTRLILAAGQVYYWKVDALDAAGQVVATSAFPNSFTVQSAALSRDLAVTGIAVAGNPDLSGNIPFTVTIANQGGSAQPNVPLRFSVSGLDATGSPMNLAMVSAGETRELSFTAALPQGQSQNMAVACIDFSDDVIVNNCKTMIINQSSGGGGDIDFSGGLSADQIWRAIQDLLKQQGTDLSEYDLDGMEGQLTLAELRDLLSAIRAGQAAISLSGPAGELAGSVQQATSAAAKPVPKKAAAAEPAAVDAATEESVPAGSEWSGLAAPLGPKASGQLISDEKSWTKLWRLIRVGRVPKVNFTEYMIAGVFAGKGEMSDHAEIASVEMSLAGLVVNYRFISLATFSVKAKTRASAPYRMRVIPRTNVPVVFKLLTETDDAPVKPKPQEKK